MAVSNNPVARVIYLVLGVFSLSIAFVGVFLPLIPTTGPVLLAAFFFARSYERFDHWLESNALFGGFVRDWRAGVGFSVRGKSVAVAAIATTFTISILFATDSMPLRLLLILLGLSIATFVVTRPTKRLTIDAPAATT